MAITSASTDRDIENQYLDASSYDYPADVGKAHLFVQACRAILVRRPQRMERGTGRSGSQALGWDLVQIKAELDRALLWLANSPEANADTGGGVTFPDFRDQRDY